MSDAKYFGTTKKGEIAELQEELNHQNKDRKKEAVKKVIAAMTVGKDVSSLFPHVVKCMETSNIELKKLVYLYIINYAKSQPDLALLAVNTFCKDSQDPSNPLIRALAVRTMGCIRVDKIAEYLCGPLRRCMKDEDPYVRKTAAICVAKMYDITPELVQDQGFLEMLQDMLSDSNPMVVANSVAALMEISETSGRNWLNLNTGTLQKLLAALNECTEWGQVFILDALATYEPSDSRESESIVERVTPRLQHANSAVVLSAVKVVMKYLDRITNQDAIRTLTRKLAPPLVTLLSAEPEIQYVALRNIDLVVQKRPNILAHEIKVFFCKYNDPIYVKMEKLEIMIRLASERNIDQVLLEFKEYATEVDVDFVRKSVRAIGRCAIKLERAAERCINVLLDLIQTRVNYVVQEAIIVIKDIFRKYPNRYETIIATLCENLENLDEPEAKASMIWILGEYAERIDNADELLDSFLENFADETAQVQLQLLTATVKLFLKRPTDTEAMVTKVLKMSTEDSDNPDLRDRGYIYWRLLSTDPEATKAVVLAEKPTISDDSFVLDPVVLDQLIDQISMLASVYQKLPDTFISKTRGSARTESDAGAEEDETGREEDYRGEDERDGASGRQTSSGAVDLLSLDDLSVSDPAPKPASSGASSLVDIFGGSPAAPAAAAGAGGARRANQKRVILPAESAGQSGSRGLQIEAAFDRRNGQVFLDMSFTNRSAAPLSGFAIQFNKNPFGFVPASPLQVAPVNPGQTQETSLPIALSGTASPPPYTNTCFVQIAVKCNVDVFYSQVELNPWVVFAEDGRFDRKLFMGKWQEIPDTNEVSVDLYDLPSVESERLKSRLEQHNVFFVAARKAETGLDVLYFALKTASQVVVLVEVTVQPAVSGVKVCFKSTDREIVPLLHQAFQQILSR
eukprot:GILJ01000896.1.p1 GENE.GILJ01000896.1~~GILJ01000896.1.p1  ORF type:complete len:928 (+),score=203.16 GILJ01000896.1:51-2786(+)